MQAYIRYLQGVCSGAIKSGEPSELDQRLLEAKVLERESKARQAKYRADAMERDLQNDELCEEILKLPQELLKNFPEKTVSMEIVRRFLEAEINNIVYR